MNKKELKETELNNVAGGGRHIQRNDINGFSLEGIERDRIERLAKKYEKKGMTYTEKDGMFQLSKEF